MACDRNFAIECLIGMRSPFIGYHRDAGGYNSERFCSSSPYGEREKGRIRGEGQGAVVNENDGCWKSRSIRFPIRAAVSGMAQEITLQPFSRDEPAIFILFSHARSDYRLAYTHRRHCRPFARGEVRLQGMMK